MTENTITTDTDTVEATEPTDTITFMSPYAAAKVVNAQLAELGIEKVLPPQMFYTYVKKNYIKSVLVDGKKKVTHTALAEWFVGYVNKNTKATVERVEDDNDEVFEDDGTIGEWTEGHDFEA
jgi:hypothetical protein